MKNLFSSKKNESIGTVKNSALFLPPPPPTSQELQFISVMSAFTRLKMKNNNVRRGLINLYVFFQNNRIIWSTNLHVKICRWGEKEKRAENSLQKLAVMNELFIPICHFKTKTFRLEAKLKIKETNWLPKKEISRLQQNFAKSILVSFTKKLALLPPPPPPPHLTQT